MQGKLLKQQTSPSLQQMKRTSNKIEPKSNLLRNPFFPLFLEKKRGKDVKFTKSELPIK